jgi:heme/copper-type cytochrome/quinol oxidase subunit 2
VSRRSSALAPLALALALTACAGTGPDTASGSGATSSATSSSTSWSTSSSAAAPSTASGQRIEVQVAGGQVTGDTGRVPVTAGEEVTLAVTSDVPDELHVHGYDLTAELVPGTPAELTFAATVPGVFEVELHDAGTVLLTIQVS